VIALIRSSLSGTLWKSPCLSQVPRNISTTAIWSKTASARSTYEKLTTNSWLSSSLSSGCTHARRGRLWMKLQPLHCITWVPTCSINGKIQFFLAFRVHILCFMGVYRPKNPALYFQRGRKWLSAFLLILAKLWKRTCFVAQKVVNKLVPVNCNLSTTYSTIYIHCVKNKTRIIKE